MTGNMDMTIATKERLGAYDAIETAKPGEPLFPLQGGDPFAPSTVKHWAVLARAEGVQLTQDHADGTEQHARGLNLLKKATQAESVAWEMESYQRADKLPEGSGRASYNDYQMPEMGADIEQAHTAREAQIKAAAALHNLVGEGAAIADRLAGVESCAALESALKNAIDQIKAVAVAVEPRRTHERT